MSLLPKERRSKGLTMETGLWDAVDKFAARVGRPERVRVKSREEG